MNKLVLLCALFIFNGCGSGGRNSEDSAGTIPESLDFQAPTSEPITDAQRQDVITMLNKIEIDDVSQYIFIPNDESADETANRLNNLKQTSTHIKALMSNAVSKCQIIQPNLVRQSEGQGVGKKLTQIRDGSIGGNGCPIAAARKESTISTVTSLNVTANTAKLDIVAGTIRSYEVSRPADVDATSVVKVSLTADLRGKGLVDMAKSTGKTFIKGTLSKTFTTAAQETISITGRIESLIHGALGKPDIETNSFLKMTYRNVSYTLSLKERQIGGKVTKEFYLNGHRETNIDLPGVTH